MVDRVVHLVEAVVPQNGVVAVVSKGDPSLLRFSGRRGEHFPQDGSGTYAGYRPADSGAAIAHLEALRAADVGFIVFPRTSLWWLEHYEGLRRYLERCYAELVRREDSAVIFDLRVARPAARSIWGSLDAVFREAERRLGRPPSILDWNTGLALCERFPEQVIFAAGDHAAELPYLDCSIDVVIASGREERLAEARRVAAAATIHVKKAHARRPLVEIDWAVGERGCTLPTVSVIVLPTAVTLIPQYVDPTDGPPAQLILVDERSDDATSAAAVNRAARAATNDVLVFVLSDRFAPLPGSLNPLLTMFRDRQDAAVVGPKVLCADGRLKEAGRAVFADGSYAAVGSGELEVLHPLYNYVRAVDAVPASVFAVRRTVFETLGGLAPAYQDLDWALQHFCAAASDQGRAVLYQPAAQIVERFGCGSTTGTAAEAQFHDWARFEATFADALVGHPGLPSKLDRSAWFEVVMATAARAAGRS